MKTPKLVLDSDSMLIQWIGRFIIFFMFCGLIAGGSPDIIDKIMQIMDSISKLIDRIA